MNEGLKICNLDFMKFNISKLKWKRIKQKPTGSTMFGRKNHAISHCAGFVHVSSGTDANLSMLNDYLIFDLAEKEWTLLKLKRAKFDKDEGHGTIVVDRSMPMIRHDPVLLKQE
jgi:hypothetical protein